jgi:restriction endonuclease S subunit
MSDQWIEVPLAEVFAAHNAKLGEHTTEPRVLSLSKYDGFVPADEYFDKRIASKKLDGYKTVDLDDWAYSTIHIDEGSIARNRLGYPGVISPMYTTMRWVSTEHSPEFFELVLRSPAMLARYGDSAQGTVNRRRSLPFKTFSSLTVLAPPLPVQRRIVDLMAHLDNHLANLQTEIDSLSELLSAIPNSRPNAKAEALGDRVRARGGKRMPKGVAFSESITAHPYLRVVDMVDGTFSSHNLEYVPEDVFPAIRRYTVTVGEIVISIVGTIGRVATVPEWAQGANLTENAAVIDVLCENLHPEWLASWLRTPAGQREIERVTVGTSQGKLALSRIPLIEVPGLQLGEQALLAELSTATFETIRQLRVEFDLLSQMRRQLLQTLLAGKVSIGAQYDSLLPEVA